jgi:hypothetical protein
MTIATEKRPAIVLVDDDYHSARLMLRMIAAHSGPQVEWMADQETAVRQLAQLCADAERDERMMVIVDLKSSSTASADFVARLHADCPSLLIVAMAPSLDREIRDHLVDTGAAAVFARHSDLNLYREEVAAIVAFWTRRQRLGAVGT